MRVLPDTCVWSLMLRRRPRQLSQTERVARFLLEDFIRLGSVVLIGPIRQELLSGVPDPMLFGRLRDHLRAFPDEPILTEDYEEASRCSNVCRSAGVASSGTDMLICVVSTRLAIPIFTTDPDFHRYALQLQMRLPTLSELQESLRKNNGHP